MPSFDGLAPKGHARQRVIQPVNSHPTPQSMTAHLDPLIQQKLSAFAGRRRRLIITRGVFAAVAMLLVTLLIVAIIDYKWEMPDWVRWSLSGGAYLAVIVVAWRHCLTQLFHAP